MADQQAMIHVWCKQAGRDVAAVYTISDARQPICVDAPLEVASETLREYLDQMAESE